MTRFAKMARLTALLLFLSVATNAQDSSVNWFDSITCGYIASRDCYTYGVHPECGTDGVTYRNRCDFSKAHCKNKDLHLLAYSPCNNITVGTTSMTGTTTPTVPILTGPNAVLDLICIEISHDKCTLNLDPICGNDLVTYDNACEYQKSKCTHRELHVLEFGPCP